MNWKTKRYFEKKHKEMVKYIRRVNKRVAADEGYGLNRYVVSEFQCRAYEFDDNDGYCRIHMIVRYEDRFTGSVGYSITNQWGYWHEISEYLGDFMCRTSDNCGNHFPPLGNWVAMYVPKVHTAAWRKQGIKEYVPNEVMQWNFIPGLIKDVPADRFYMRNSAE